MVLTLAQKRKAMAHARSFKKGINRSRGPKNAAQANKPAYQRHINRTVASSGYHIVKKPRVHAVKNRKK